MILTAARVRRVSEDDVTRVSDRLPLTRRWVKTMTNQSHIVPRFQLAELLRRAPLHVFER